MTSFDDFVSSVADIPGVTVKGDTITIRPARKASRLRINKNGKGYATSYTLSIGCAEARELGFIDADGQPVDLKKTIDAATHTLTVRPMEE